MPKTGTLATCPEPEIKFMPGKTACRPLLTLPLMLALAAPAAASGTEAGLPHAFDAGWEGQSVCTLLHEDESLRVARCVFPPGVGHEPHFHDPHFGYVLEGGTLRIRDAAGERTVTTVAGSEWYSPERTQHEAVNIGDSVTSYLIVEPR